MGRRPKQTLLQRKHAAGQEAHGKMFNIAHYQRNENPNYNEVSPHTRLSLKIPQIINSGESIERKGSSYTIGGNVNWYSHYGEQYRGSLRN